MPTAPRPRDPRLAGRPPSRRSTAMYSAHPAAAARADLGHAQVPWGSRHAGKFGGPTWRRRGLLADLVGVISASRRKPSAAGAARHSFPDRPPVILGGRAGSGSGRLRSCRGCGVLLPTRGRPSSAASRIVAHGRSTGGRGVVSLRGRPRDQRIGRAMDAHYGVLAHALFVKRPENGCGTMARPPLLVDLGDRRLERRSRSRRAAGRGQQVAAARRDLFGRPRLLPGSCARGPGADTPARPRCARGRDGYEVRGRCYSRRSPGSARPPRSHPEAIEWDVHVRLTGPRRLSSLTRHLRRLSRGSSRSRQIGWNTVSHCSGASMMNVRDPCFIAGHSRLVPPVRPHRRSSFRRAPR